MPTLVNIVHEGDKMRLVYPRSQNNQPNENVLEYVPSFYLISPEPDYALDVVEKHPLVSRCIIEEKYPNIHARERERVLRVFVPRREFRRVALDVSRLGETAEVTIPHHYRYVLEKGLAFFEPEGPLSTALMKKGERVPDADVVFTHGGDAFLRNYPGVLVSKMGCFLRHAVHIDLDESGHYDVYGDDGGDTRLARVMELSRLTGVKPDVACRVTPGKLNTFLHMRAAKARGYLIPDKKKEMEKPKTLEMLRRMDRGGTIFYPKPGVYSNVGKCDFSSMYPHIIVRHNISPEAMHCECGDDEILPVCGWRVCRKRGIIPDGIEAVLVRRMELKRRLREGGFDADLDARQKALKGILVTCLDGDTLIPHLVDGRLKLEKIKDIVEPLSDGKEGTFDVQGDIRVFGLDESLRTIQNPVKRMLKLPSKGMVRLKLDWQRELKVTEDHPCYVLEDGHLRVKRADELRGGDYIPILSSINLPLNTTKADLLAELMAKLPEEERIVWRVHGYALKGLIAENFDAIMDAARGEFTYRAIRNWLRYGYIPLKFLHLLGPLPDPSHLAIGRGKRTGGLIRKLPASLEIDKDLGFFLGFFAGDGSYGGSMLRLDLGIHETEEAKLLSKILWEKFRLTATLRKEKKANMYVFQVNSLALNRIMKLVFGLGGSSDSGKLETSPFILNSNRDFLFGFISGLIASDGYINKVRNFISIASSNHGFVLKLGFLFSILGLEYRIANSSHCKNGKKYSLYQIQLRDARDLRLLYDNGILKASHRRKIEERGETSTSYRRPQFPVYESGFFRLCRKSRTPPWLGQRDRITKAQALEQIGRIRAERLSPEDRESLERLKHLAQSDLVFAKVVETVKEAPDSPFVYCFEVERNLPGFVCQGGIFTHNCFGYLGFNNFVFSNVECKECVMLMGRVILERTKAIAEEEGLDVLYGIVDSVFVSNPQNNLENFERYAARVSGETGIELVLDCIFLKIKFLPSYDGSGAANRYFGITADGKIEARGIALRHSDAPEFLKRYQAEAIPAYFSGNFAVFREVYARHKERLLEKKIPLDDLSIHKRMRQREYKTEQAHVIAYNEKPDGRKSVDFVHTVYGPRRTELARLEEIDATEYLRLLERARWEICGGSGHI